MEKLECTARNIFQWFFNNPTKASPDKCHFLSSLDMDTKISVGSFDVENPHLEKLLGIITDWKLKFHDYVSNLCKKVSANTAQKMKFSIRDFFSKCDQIGRK